jgi:hypothetical protein
VATSFKPPSKSLTPRDYLFIGLLTLAFAALCLGLYYLNRNLEGRFGGGGEFFVPWAAGRAFMFERFDPYSAHVPGRVQELIYGRAARPGEEPYILDIPFHILPVYFPFSLLWDPQPARVMFAVVTELALFGLAFLSLRLADWESPGFLAVIFFAFCLSSFYTVQALIESTPVLVLGFLYAGILTALRLGQDELAGAMAALSFYYWEVGGPFLLLVFLMVIYQRRTRVLAGFGMVAFILLAISFLLYPNWVIPFFRAALNNLRTEYGFSLHSILASLWPEHGRTLAWIFIPLLLVGLGYEWSMARAADDRRFYWASCLTLAATPLLGFRSELENLVVLVIPLAFVFAVTHQRWRRIGVVFALFLVLVALAIPWLIFFYGLPAYGEVAEQVLHLFYPLFAMIGLYWIRWWAVRPPRLWQDQVREIRNR